MPEKHAVALSKWAQKMTKKRKVTNTVFKVSLPLTKGAVLLERTSFSKDTLPLSCAYSPSSDPDLIPSPESQTEDFELDTDTESNHTNHTSVFTTSQLQQDLYNEDGGAHQYMGPEGTFTVTRYQEVDDYFSDDKHFNQSEDVTETRDQKVFAERNYHRQHSFKEKSSTNFSKDLKNKCLQTQNEGLSPAVSHTQDWTSYNSSYACKESYAESGYSTVAQSKIGTGVEVSSEKGQKEMGSDATWHHYQQQYQCMAQDHASLVPQGHRGLSGELVPHFDAARISMHPYLGDCYAHSASTAPEPRTQFREIEQRQLQTYMEFSIGHIPTAPQNYMIQPTVYQDVQVGYGVTGDPDYNSRPRTNDNQHFPHPVSGGSGVGGMFQSNAYIPLRQAPCYGTHSDVNFSATGLSGAMISGSDNGTVQLMHCNSQFEFCI